MADVYGRAAFAFDVGSFVCAFRFLSLPSVRRREKEKREVGVVYLLLGMGTELVPGIVCCGSSHHVAPWEQYRNGGEPVKQVIEVFFVDVDVYFVVWKFELQN